MHRADPVQQASIDLSSRGRLTPTPSMVTGRQHAEHPGHGADRKGGLVRVHELENPDGIVLVSRGDQAAALAGTSRSWRSYRLSRRRRANSSFPELLRLSLP